MESSPRKIVLHVGGSWPKDYTLNPTYDGDDIQEYELDFPSSLTSYSVLMDLARRVAQLEEGSFKLSYLAENEHGENVAVELSNDEHLRNFLLFEKDQVGPVDVYLIEA
ncbi:hypothetical protein M8C21_012510 [Ambrosia artemisiifolia]|uniref:Uncharacterized protein n=1 Tax=Ambrosia artemisiifolia TaxID=4212 RepID=A0AAD5BZ10_AMBAR|nr:hypothetical protein M8C21_012510 [Ambrosia artemisiifolia]